MPEVTIIVPVYNCEAYLHPCIDSILQQTFRDFELILVDDGSSDASGRIIDHYAEADTRIRCVHQENGGPSSARNAGLAIASGKYIYMADSDDVLCPQLLSKAAAAFTDDTDLLVFGFETFSKSGGREQAKKTVFKARRIALTSEEDRYTFLTGPFARGQIRWEVWNRMFRRDLIETWQVRFPESPVTFPEDLYFCFCYLAHASGIRLIPDVLYRHRQSSRSLIAKLYEDPEISEGVLAAEALEKYYRSFADSRYLADRFLPFRRLFYAREIVHMRRCQWRRGYSMPEIRAVLEKHTAAAPDFREVLAESGVFSNTAADAGHPERRAVRMMNRLYMEEILDLPATPAGRRIRQGMLGVFKSFYQWKHRRK